MRIALVAPGWFPVPPEGYGGIELVVGLLADGLAERGHDVTLFAAAGSQTEANLAPQPWDPPARRDLGNPWLDAAHALATYLEIDDSYDVVHDHAGVMGPACAAMMRGRVPVVHTLHGPWTEATRRLYSVVNRHVDLVAISDAQAAENPDVSYAGTVYNGVDLGSYPYHPEKEEFLVYIGRATPDKAPAEAIHIARHAERPLKMVVKRSEPAELAYFEREVEPLLGRDVELFENVLHDEKVDLLGRAHAMIFPIRWPEPFGLVMVEAMACGTPVVTTNWGAAPELVDDGITGFRRDRAEDLADACNLVADLDPWACRVRVKERFSAEAMVAGYEAVYASVSAS